MTLVISNRLTGMRVESNISQLEGRNFSATLRETAGNLKS